MIDPRELTPIQIKQAAGRLRGGQLMRFVDSTLLAPQATSDEINRLVDDAVKLRAPSVSIRRTCSEYLQSLRLFAAAWRKNLL